MSSSPFSRNEKKSTDQAEKKKEEKKGGEKKKKGFLRVSLYVFENVARGLRNTWLASSH
jgi:ribosomal protein S25